MTKCGASGAVNVLSQIEPWAANTDSGISRDKAVEREETAASKE